MISKALSLQLELMDRIKVERTREREKSLSSSKWKQMIPSRSIFSAKIVRFYSKYLKILNINRKSLY